MRVLWLLTSWFLTLSTSTPPKQPHIVMIIADDMGYQDVGFRGSDIFTPNIDRLARKGVILENHYVNAICAPTRASLMTGRYTTRTGFWKGNINPVEEFGIGLEETLLPEMLKRNGYSTHGVGKWHCGSYTSDHTPVKRGFDTFFGLYLGSQDYFTHRNPLEDWLDFRDNYLDASGNLVDNIRDDLNGTYNTNLFTNKSVELIKNHDEEKPLFLYLSYTAPHIPDQAPEQDIERFSSDWMNDTRKTYAAMVSIMDEGIGKVEKALKERGLMDNTILVFTSDNGARFSMEGSNFPLRGGKGSYLEGGIRAVAFVNSPLLNTSGYINTNIHHVTDWYATFQRLAGDTPERHGKVQLPIDGVDIWSSLKDNKPCREEVLLDLRDPLKYLDPPNDTSDSNITESETCKNCFELTGVEVKDWSPSLLEDFFALRWRNWKLIAGSLFKLEGWSSKNRLDGFLNFTDDKEISRRRAWASGVVLFDLSMDIREENNLAAQRPDIVQQLLDKKQGYLQTMISVKYRKLDNITMEDGIYRPWVETPVLLNILDIY